MSLKPEYQNEIHFLKRRIGVDNFGGMLDQRYVKGLLDATATNHCKSMATLRWPLLDRRDRRAVEMWQI